MEKVKIGRKYQNLHTGIVCEVTQKNFSTIGYREDTEPTDAYPHYCHYKRFQKHWIEVPDPNGD